MDSVSLAASLVSAQIGRVRLEIAGQMLRIQADPDASAAAAIESAQQCINDFALLAARLGSKLDVSV
jgi:hypothetical protein